MSVLRTDARGPQPSPPEVIFGLAIGYLASRSLHVANRARNHGLAEGRASKHRGAGSRSLKSRPDDFA